MVALWKMRCTQCPCPRTIRFDRRQAAGLGGAVAGLPCVVDSRLVLAFLATPVAYASWRMRPAFSRAARQLVAPRASSSGCWQSSARRRGDAERRVKGAACRQAGQEGDDADIAPDPDRLGDGESDQGKTDEDAQHTIQISNIEVAHDLSLSSDGLTLGTQRCQDLDPAQGRSLAPANWSSAPRDGIAQPKLSLFTRCSLSALLT